MTTSINENELESISEEINNIIQEFIDNNNNNNVSNEYYYDDDRKFEEYINEQYEEFLKKENNENNFVIGYCGFPCDSKCCVCIGSGTFDMTDEV